MEKEINHKGSWCNTGNITCSEGYCSGCWLAIDKTDYLLSSLFGGVVYDTSMVMAGNKEREN